MIKISNMPFPFSIHQENFACIIFVSIVGKGYDTIYNFYTSPWFVSLLLMEWIKFIRIYRIGIIDNYFEITSEHRCSN